MRKIFAFLFIIGVISTAEASENRGIYGNGGTSEEVIKNHTIHQVYLSEFQENFSLLRTNHLKNLKTWVAKSTEGVEFIKQYSEWEKYSYPQLLSSLSDFKLKFGGTGNNEVDLELALGRKLLSMLPENEKKRLMDAVFSTTPSSFSSCHNLSNEPTVFPQPPLNFQTMSSRVNSFVETELLNCSIIKTSNGEKVEIISWHGVNN